MTDAALITFVTGELDVRVEPEVEAVASQLARDLHGVAILYYGSTLRTGDFDGVLDFYVLTSQPVGKAIRRLGIRWLWPDVSYHEVVVDGRTIRAKVATMPISTFEMAARGHMLDTTIWTRFVQPAALVWQADPTMKHRVVRAVADSIMTAARFAAVLGPSRGEPRDFWLALFRETYRAELRVEPPGREAVILTHDPDRYTRLLPIAWEAAGVEFEEADGLLAPGFAFDLGRATAQAWLYRADTGKLLNVARLIKAAFTFDGAARYGAWKVHRHTGVAIELTPWRERHPILASFSVIWRVLRARTL